MNSYTEIKQQADTSWYTISHCFTVFVSRNKPLTGQQPLQKVDFIIIIIIVILGLGLETTKLKLIP